MGESKDELKNTLLNYVSFEITFSPRVHIRSNLSKYQETIRKNYPIFSEFVIPFMQNAPENFWEFKSEDGWERIIVQINRVSFEQSEYLGFRPLKKKVNEALLPFLKTNGIESIDLKLRYVYRVPLDDSSKDVAQLQAWFNLPFNSQIFDKDQIQYESKLEYKVKGISVDTINVFKRATSINKSYYIIDLSTSVNNKKRDDLESLLDGLYNVLNGEFNRSITDVFKDAIKEEEVQ